MRIPGLSPGSSGIPGLAGLRASVGGRPAAAEADPGGAGGRAGSLTHRGSTTPRRDSSVSNIPGCAHAPETVLRQCYTQIGSVRHMF